MADKQDANQIAYEECVEHSKSRGFWASYHAMVEDGYDPNVDWVQMLSEWTNFGSEPVAAPPSTDAPMELRAHADAGKPKYVCDKHGSDYMSAGTCCATHVFPYSLVPESQPIPDAHAGTDEDAREATKDWVRDYFRANPKSAFTEDDVAVMLDARTAALEKQVADLTQEIRSIDAVMERRPALDKPTRWQNVEFAIVTAKNADEYKRRAEAAEKRISELEGIVLKKDAELRLSQLQHGGK